MVCLWFLYSCLRGVFSSVLETLGSAAGGCGWFGQFEVYFGFLLVRFLGDLEFYPGTVRVMANQVAEFLLLLFC
jgi:hypothetical protein